MNTTSEPLWRATAQTFEQLCFLPLELATAPNESEEMCSASVTFVGPRRGRVCVRIPLSALREAMANMLGQAPPIDPSPRERADTLGEIANVICGHALTGIYGKSDAFVVGAPHSPAEPLPSSATAVFADCAGRTVEVRWAEEEVGSA